MQKKLAEYAKLVGNTPLICLRYEHAGVQNEAFFKLEFYNPSGSIKDRMALQIARAAAEAGALHERSHIAEATSGNTGLAFSSLGAFLGLKTTIFMPEWMSAERKALIAHYGANLRLVSAAEGGFEGSVRLAEELAARDADVFLPRQFSNPQNPSAQANVALEAALQLGRIGRKIEAFVAGVGTGGTIMGARAALPGAKCCGVEPEGCASMSYPGQNAQHRIEGIGDGFVPEIVDLAALEAPIIINDGDAICAAQKLARAGLAVGISSGANLLAAIAAKQRYGAQTTVASVFADDAKKYLSTDLMREITPQDGWLSKELKILNFEVIR